MWLLHLFLSKKRVLVNVITWADTWSRSIGQIKNLIWWWKPKLLQSILRWTSMSELHFMAIHPRVVETFHSKPQMSTSWWRQKKSQRITRVIRIHHLGTIYVCTKYFMTIPPVVVEIFQSGPKWWTDQPTHTLPSLQSCRWWTNYEMSQLKHQNIKHISWDISSP